MTDDIKLKRKRLSPVSIVLISLVVFVFSAIVVGGAFVLLYEPDPNKSNFGAITRQIQTERLFCRLTMREAL